MELRVVRHPVPHARMERISRLKFAKRMSPWNITRRNEFTIMGRKQIAYDLGWDFCD